MTDHIQPTASSSMHHCVIYGGNGYVGTAIAKALIALGARVSCVSRTGEMPTHLYFQGEDWSKQVNWLQGDALDPNKELLQSATSVITLIGSPPVPTMSVSARRQQEFNNGEPNAKVIRTAALCGVKRIVLMAAEIPKFMQSKKFGYYLGKNISIRAAEDFVENDAACSAAILYPFGIYGTRYLKNGTAIPLHWLMAPIAAIQHRIPVSVAKHLPPSLVSVEQVGLCAAESCLAEFTGIKHIDNQAIAQTDTSSAKIS